MVSELILPSLVVSLIGFLVVGAGAFIIMSITKISRREFQEDQTKQDKEFERKIASLEVMISKEREESERLFNKEIMLVKQQLDFVVSGISDIKEQIYKK